MLDTKRRKSNKDKAYENYTLFQSFKTTHREKWHLTNQEGYDFALNDQINSDLQTKLDSAGMPDFIINMILPAVELMKYFLTANNPRWQAVGRDGSDTDFAAVFAAITEYVWHGSKGKSILGLVVTDIITKSKGYFHVIQDPDGDRGLGEVRVVWENAFDVYEAPDSSDPYGDDSSAKIIYKRKTRQALLDMFPQYEKKIKKASFGTTFENYSQRDLVQSLSIQPEDITEGYNIDGSISDMLDYYEKYRKVKVDYVNVTIAIPPSAKDIAEFNKAIEIEMTEMKMEIDVELQELKNDLGQQLQEGKIIKARYDFDLEKAGKDAEKALADRRQLLISQARENSTKVEQRNITKEEYELLKDEPSVKEFIVSAIPYYETRIQRNCSVGDQLLYEYLLPEPISEYPLFSIPAIFTGTPFPMSFISPAIGKQKEINRAHQIMIHNASLGSNLRALIQQGQVDDEEWDTNMSVAGARLYWNNLGDGTKPEFIQPMPLNTAFYNIVEKGQSDIEYLIGMFGSAMGIIQDQPETYRGMLANDEFSTRRLRGWIINIFEPGMEKLGLIVNQFAQATYGINKVFKVVQPNAETGEVKSISEEVNIPMYNDLGDEVGRYNDLQSAEYNVAYVAGSTMPLNRWALLEEYFRWFESGIIDDIEFIRHTDIQDKEGLMKRKSIYSGLRSQVEGLEGAIKKREGDIETLERQLLELRMKVKEAGMVSEMRKDVVDNQSRMSLLAGEFKQEVDYGKKKIKDFVKDKTQKVDNKPKK